VLDDLARGEGDAAQRVFDRSFNLPQLGGDGRDALLALSLFAPDASRPALAEISGFGDDEKRLREAVMGLAALCLVETASTGERLVIKGLTRDLARARLKRDERADEFRRRFVAFFLRHCETHAETTPEDFDALEAEKENVLGAMDAAFEIEDWNSVTRMADATGRPVSGFFSLRGHWGEAIRCNQQALEAARRSKSEADIAGFTHNLAVMHGSRGDLAEARRLYNESLEITKRLGNQSGIAGTLHGLAILAQDQGDIEEARRLYNESLEINNKLGDQSGIGISLHQLARLAQDQGEIEEARRLCNKSLEISKKLGFKIGVAGTLHQLAMLSQDQGEIEEARGLYNESLEINKKLGDQSGIARTLHNLAKLAQDQGEIEEARRLYNESLEIKKELDNQSGIAITLHQFGRLAEDQGHMAEAAGLFREALTISEKLKSPYAELARKSLERVESKLNEALL
jgi:tetratricopeptide (TPR) repeat protein